MDFLSGSDGKQSACNVGDAGSIPGSGRSPGGGNDYPFKYSCLENSMNRVYMYQSQSPNSSPAFSLGIHFSLLYICVSISVLQIRSIQFSSVTQWCLSLCDPMDCRLFCPWNSPKNTRVGCHSLLQGIFLTQGSNPSLPHCRQILYHFELPGHT